MGGKGARLLRNMYKGHMDKTKWGGIMGWVPIAGLGEVMGGKWSQLYLNNNKKMWKENVLLLFLGYWVRRIGHAEDRYSLFWRFRMFSLKAQIAGSLLGQETCLSSGPGPWLGNEVATDRCFCILMYFYIWLLCSIASHFRFAYFIIFLVVMMVLFLLCIMLLACTSKHLSLSPVQNSYLWW